MKKESEQQQLLELKNAIENGNVVVNMQGEEFLMNHQDGDDFQVFCNGKTNLSQGWLKSDGTPEDGVEKGEYYMCDDNGNWSMTKAVWSKNKDCLTPYEVSDFQFNGSFFEKR